MIPPELLDWHFALLERDAKAYYAAMDERADSASRPVREFRPTSTGLPREDER